ncbi:hypothetical protein O6H91_20G024400 [Diphasiastrum complanatum]|uniref:Uncharacterized protein n=1 Tax=Diphasiastrum complanatum TaxID=34168 RepID=A0ACC2ANE7_DIPCM|nr:hypothetical protein O6H91_Y508900 [Diphasiastrum complanatum]KAJ7519133.1 hypothetical protein O6H91_20G024400 [Diphasiastrum complanatum]
MENSEVEASSDPSITNLAAVENHKQHAPMDDQIWRQLPEDCIDRILAKMPLPSIFRFRPVCKRWNFFIFSDAFFCLQSEITSRPHRFLLCSHGRVACIYSFISQQWHFLSLPKFISPITVAPVSLVSASGSLLCYGNLVAECTTLFICSPFTKTLRNLPVMQRIRLIHKVSMIADPSTNSYKIMVAGENRDPFTNPHTYSLFTEIYHSVSDSWTMAGCPPAEAKFGATDPGVWCSGVFYCITELPYGVLAFNLKREQWQEVRAPMPSCLSSPSLLEHRGRLLMVGRVCHSQGAQRKRESMPEVKSIRIWELRSGDQREDQWVEIQKMPTNLCMEFMKSVKPNTPIVCVGVENLVCLATQLSPQVLVHDLSNEHWHWLPRDPLFPKCRNFHLLGFSLKPRLETQP